MQTIKIRSTAEVILTVEVPDGAPIHSTIEDLKKADVVYYLPGQQTRITETAIRKTLFKPVKAKRKV